MNRSTAHPALPVLGLALLFPIASGCAAARSQLAAPALSPLSIGAAQPEEKLEHSVFQRDQTGGLSEDDLRRVLAAPVYLEEQARIGIVPVAESYALDAELPTVVAPGVLGGALDGAGYFGAVSEVSTDWPTASGLSGLRELAARYRAEYLLLYRHRFVEDSYLNAWGLAYVTLIGGLIVPAQTSETAGVLEATLFDVKSGTLLFTVFERTHGETEGNVWSHDRNKTVLRNQLIEEASQKLSKKVVDQVGRLVAARPKGVEVAGTPGAYQPTGELTVTERGVERLY